METTVEEKDAAPRESARVTSYPALRMEHEREAYIVRVGGKRAGRVARSRPSLLQQWGWVAGRGRYRRHGWASSRTQAETAVLSVVSHEQQERRALRAARAVLPVAPAGADAPGVPTPYALRQLHILLLSLEEANPFALSPSARAATDWMSWVKRARALAFGGGE